MTVNEIIEQLRIGAKLSDHEAGWIIQHIRNLESQLAEADESDPPEERTHWHSKWEEARLALGGPPDCANDPMTLIQRIEAFKQQLAAKSEELSFNCEHCKCNCMSCRGCGESQNRKVKDE